MLTIDGSQGEGGGQILRSALALSLVTGTPFRINRIRYRRNKPGLMRQHLTAVNAAVEIGGAKVEGNQLGSAQLTFVPSGIRAGKHHFSTGTAGSCTLVMQTVLPALCLAAGPSELILEGGTHNPFAPPFDFMARTFLPLVTRMGPKLATTLIQPGFFPGGGGRMTVRIEPTNAFRRIDLLHRGRILGYHACAMVANLPRHIAERELQTVEKSLGWEPAHLLIEEITHARGPGNALLLEIRSEHITEIFTGFGERRVTAEQVAQRTCRMAREYLSAQVPVGSYLADQLLLPLALAGGGWFRTLKPTLHTMTNIEVVKSFLNIAVEITQKEQNAWEIRLGSEP